MDVGVYAKAEVLRHKRRDGFKPNECYWLFATSASKVGLGDRIWFATEGRWQGSFVIHDHTKDRSEVRFYSDSWTPYIPHVERKPFQGFTYAVPSDEGGPQ